MVAAANPGRDRYIADRYPARTRPYRHLIDEAGSRLRIRRMATPADYKAIEDDIVKVRRDKEIAIEKQNFEQAKKLREKEEELLQRKAAKEQEWRAEGVDLFDVVDEEVIAEVLANWTGIPVYKLTEEETARLLRMEDELHKRVIGQQDAIKAILQAIRRRPRPGSRSPKLGPAGRSSSSSPSRRVGKTETAAKTRLGRVPLLRRRGQPSSQLDMSEYMEKHTVSPAGRLASRLRRVRGGWPAHRSGAPQALLRGALRRDREGSTRTSFNLGSAAPDPRGRPPDRLAGPHGGLQRTATVIIMTSNLGTADLRKASVGFAKYVRGRHLRER